MLTTLHINPDASQASGSRSGFTVVEIAIALIVLSVGIGGLVAASLSSYQLSRANQERSAAHDAARQMVEEIRSLDPELVFATYNLDPTDDPDGPGTAQGPNFNVEALNTQSEDADGMVGAIVFPTDEFGALREDVGAPALGMPRDLSLDGVVDSLDHANDFVLLPVSVQLDWSGGKGQGHYQVEVLLLGDPR